MNLDQIILFVLMGSVLGFLLWGRFRYDLVAFCALTLAVVLGAVPPKDAFSGFGHQAVIIIALVRIVSRALRQSGAIDLLTRRFVDAGRGLTAHIASIGVLGAVLSAFMNNVAALALLMQVDLQAASTAKRSPSLTLMPLSFATILGGMVTLIGTPPNVVIAQFRRTALGEPYEIFDFAPVGIGCAVAGLVFVSFLGWRFVPTERTQVDTGKELINLEGYVAEVQVSEGSDAIGKTVHELVPTADEHDVILLGLIRGGKRLPGQALSEEVRKGDVFVVEAGPEALEQFASAVKLSYSTSAKHTGAWAGTLSMTEAVVPLGARIERRSAYDMRLLYRHGVMLLGVSREGRPFRDRVRKLKINAGDVLLLLGSDEILDEVVSWLGCLPLADRDLLVAQREKAWLAIGIFAAAITLAGIGLVYLPAALAACVALFVLLKMITLSQLYEAVEWPVIILLASLIPIGAALEVSGGTALIAEGILTLTEGWPVYLILLLLMIVTMTLSDMLNNVATVLVAAPVAIDVATRLEVNPDTLLMGVAVAASCAFLTPIGHKNNTIVMGPGGYRFGDYWRMGLPLEIVILVVGIPLILFFWPL
jgi:di/tricarboxylate transporter